MGILIIPNEFELLNQLDVLKLKKLDTTKTQEFLSNYQNVAQKVSEYAMESPLEFVAEVYAKTLCGAKFDKEVMDLYAKYGGKV